MITNTNIEIPLSKSKLIIMMLASLAFVALGLWFIISPPFIDNTFLGNPLLIMIVGYASILFFGACAIFLLRKLADNKPGLIINDLGIYDNSSAVSGGQILWTDITRFSIMKIQRQKLILIHVHNPDEYINKQSSSLKKRMMRMNHNISGTPLSITANGLKISYSQLFQILTARLISMKEKNKNE